MMCWSVTPALRMPSTAALATVPDLPDAAALKVVLLNLDKLTSVSTGCELRYETIDPLGVKLLTRALADNQSVKSLVLANSR
jgi:hypothetical protein